VISWGGSYTMTWAFFAKFVDEAYAIADPDWISAKKTTPGGLSLQQLEQAMQALKNDSAESSDVKVPHLRKVG